jgi:hypothetical protein
VIIIYNEGGSLHMSDIPKIVQEHLNSKLCHDLANPLGTMQLSLDDIMQNEARFIIVKECMDITLGRLALYRFAYGPLENLENHSIAEWEKAFEKFLIHSKITLQPIKNESVITSDQAKLLLNLFLIVVDFVPFGGELSVQIQDNNIGFSFDAKRILAKDISLCEENELSPKSIQTHYFSLLLQQFAYQLKQSDKSILIYS